MTTPTESSTRRERSVLYIVVSIVLVILAVWAAIAFSSARESQRAEEKADELIQTLEEAGATAPDRDIIIRVLGDDGGATCADPNNALSRATLYAMLANGSGGPGSRPVIVNPAILRGQLAIIQVYCPDELAEFQEFIDSLDPTGATNG